MSIPTPRTVVQQSLLAIGAFIFISPIFLIVVNAFKLQADIRANPLGIPFDRLTLANLAREATNPANDLIGAYALSAAVMLVCVTITVVLGSTVGYVLARSHSRLAVGAYLLLLAGILVPPAATLLPLVKLLAALNLMFTVPGLILVDVASYLPLAVLLYTGFIRALPYDLEEAARVDGASPLQIYWHVVLPLLNPATVTVAIIIGLICLTDFVNPSVILGPGGSNTITTAINQAIGKYSTDYEQVYAALWLVTVPMIVVFIFMQGRLRAGLTEGALRG